jgi:PAS domain S-box-containing protein
MEDPKNINWNKFSWLITDHISAMLAYWDNKQVCRFANNAYREWFGKTPEEMIGKMTMKELLGPLYEKNLPYITAALKGEKQVFEREISLPGGGTRHSIATYYPDIAEGKVRGFFVHVADVTPIKLLQEKLQDLERSKKKEVLYSIIETREKEKESIAHELRDSVSQTLAYCKMMLQNANNKEPDSNLLNEITKNIHQAIHQLNILSNNLSPSVVGHFGLKPGLEDYIISFQNQYNRTVLFECKTEKIEELAANDKISVFRIIQDYLLLLADNPVSRKISVAVDYDPPGLSLTFSHDDVSFELPQQSREYSDIRIRVEYYEGSLKESKGEKENILQIELNMKKP